jgi:hypothetical protein
VFVLLMEAMRPKILSMTGAWLLALCLPAADAPAPGASTPARRAEEAYHDARALHDAQPTNTTAAWRFASACFDECEFAQNNADRARVAKEGILACRQALASDPALAPAHYYLAMDLGQVARTELWGALSLLGEMEKEWQTAIKLDEDFDFAGADRNLGLLYRDAPNWPVSLGSRTNARQHLLRAVWLHPEYPENPLCLLEAYVKWNDHADSAPAAKALEQMLPEARNKFSGPAWESSWDSWDNRWKALQREMSQRPEATAPHNKK